MRFCVDLLKTRESKKLSLILFLIYLSMLSFFCTTANSHYIQTHQYIIALSADTLAMDGYSKITNFLMREVFDENAKQTKTFLQILQEGARDADLRANGLFGFPTTSFNNCWDLTQKDTCDNTIKDYSYDILGWPVGDHFFDPDDGKGIFSTYNLDSYLNEKENECETCFEDLIREVVEKYPAAPDPRQKLIDIMGSSNAAAMAKEFYSRAIIEWNKSQIDESHLVHSMYNLGIALHLIQDLTVPHHAQPKMPYENHDDYESQVWKNPDYGLKEGNNTFTNINGDYKFYSYNKSDQWAIDNAQVFKNLDPYDYDNSITESIKYLLSSTAGAIAAFFVDVGFISIPAVPDTGQTKCYNGSKEITCPQPGQPYYGQDAHYPRNLRSYTKLRNGGVVLANDTLHTDDGGSWTMTRDNVTGLIWEIKTNANRNDKYTWANAQSVFIAQLNAQNFGGFSDWRLATAKELSSLADKGIYNPAIDPVWFPKTVSTSMSYYWSSTTCNWQTGKAWTWGSYYGLISNHYKSGNHYVRAVRGGNG